jgi:hypothetical protein
MQTTRQKIAKIGFSTFLIPGVLFLIIEFSSKLGQSNPFIIASILLNGGLIGLVGFIVFLFMYQGEVKKKLIISVIGFAFYIGLLPTIWGVNSIREKVYLSKNQTLLENLATEVLTDKITIDEANKILSNKDLILHVSCVPEENLHVLFLISGMIDNCYGFSYSLTDMEPSWNCCGDITSWKKIKKNWFRWTTT